MAQPFASLFGGRIASRDVSKGIDRVVESLSAGLCRHPGLCDDRLDQTVLCERRGNLVGGGRGKLEQLSSYIIGRSGGDQKNAARIPDRNECLAGVNGSLAQQETGNQRPAALYRAQDRAAVVISVLNFQIDCRRAAGKICVKQPYRRDTFRLILIK